MPKSRDQRTGHEPLEWFTPVAFPRSAARDTRTSPGDLALLLALHASCTFCESCDCSVSNDRVLQLTGLRSPKALYGHRRNLERWGYVAIRPITGMPTEYGCPLLAGLEDEVAIPAIVALEHRTRPGHIACYLALSVLAEDVRRSEWPTHRDPAQRVDPEGRRTLPPLFPTHTEATNRRVMRFAGFSGLRQLYRYRRDLAEWGLLEWTTRPGRAAIYALTASATAEQELKQRIARWEGLPTPWLGARSAAKSAEPPHRHSPASFILARNGVSLRDLARALGASTANVSMQLAGIGPPHPRLLPVLRALAGSETAAEVQRLMRAATVRRRTEPAHVHGRQPG